jgi:hypothetical protein
MEARLTNLGDFIFSPTNTDSTIPYHDADECYTRNTIWQKKETIIYTLSALIDLPDAIATHSPGAVEYPVFIVIPAICGDHARFVISLCAV